MIQEKRNKFARVIAQQMLVCTDVIWSRCGFFFKYERPYDKYVPQYNRLTSGTTNKWAVREYIKDNFNIDNKLFSNKVLKEYIKLLNRKSKELAKNPKRRFDY